MPEEPEGQAAATEPTTDGPKLGIGDRVGRYELLGVLGEGGMSYVYLAHDPELDRDVALKLMRVRVGTEGARRLYREAQALAKLSHPNVVPVYDAGMVGGQAFVAMEYVQGKTLRKWLRGGRTWRQVVDVMGDAGMGLAAAHARGLIHRDFKPDNVLLGDDGRVRVLDFGLARLAGVLEGSIVPSNPGDTSPPPSSRRSQPGDTSPPSSRRGPSSVDVLITRADQLIGTPAYMAPEQMRREAVDARTDIFAFGVTLYEALFGKRPFDTPSFRRAGSEAATVTASISDANLTSAQPPPRNTKVPRHIQRAVMRALAFDPAGRWPSVDSMLAELRRDPWRTWRRVGMGAAVVAAAGVVTVSLVRSKPDTRSMCHGGPARQSSVWGAGARDAVRAAFSKTSVPYATDAVTAVARELDGYTARLAESTDDACAATRVRGEQTEGALDLRMACYEDRWREVSALVDLLARADVETVNEAAHAAHSLPSLDECADIAALRAPTPLPRDPDLASKVDGLDKRLASVVASHAIGKTADAAASADVLLEDARKVGFLPVIARVDLWRGRAYADLGSDDKSMPAFKSAFAEALAAREDTVLKNAAVRLAQEYIYAHQPAEFEYWASVGQAAIDRGSPDPHLQSFLDHTRCVALYNPGKMVDRLACLERHAAQVEPTRPLDDWELTTLGLAAVDVGQYDRGLDYVRRGYDYSLRTNGPMHPRTLEMRMYECKAQIDAGDFDGGLATCGATLHDMEKLGSDTKTLLARDRLYTALALTGDQRYDAARSELALARASGADSSETLAAEAKIDASTGHPDRAIPQFRKALAEEQQELPPEHPDVIDAKLALGKALLDHHDLAEARAVLDEALAAATRGQISPTMLADAEFADARALWATAPADRARALDQARRALEVYVASGARTRGLATERDAIEAWLAQAVK